MASWINLAASTFWKDSNFIRARDVKFKETFGCNPGDCVEIWHALVMHNLVESIRNNYRPIHLLWALFFVKHYLTMAVNAYIVGTSPRTFREKVWYILEAIASLENLWVSTMLPLEYKYFLC